MKATVYTEYGSPDVLKLTEVATPTLGDNNVLIQIHTAALNAGEDIILKIDVQGATFVRKRMPEGLFIFITPPSTDELLNRLTGRNTESPQALEIRQKEALIELGLAKDYEHVVCNRDVDETAREILAMIAAEHGRHRAAV